MSFSACQPDQAPLTATVSAITPVRENIRILRLKPHAPFSWQAGQFINISFGGLPPRPYSLACAPGKELEIHIKRGTGPASAYVMDELKENETVHFTGPEGRNIYDSATDEPILALAGGLGIAPVKAIAEQALESGYNKPFTLYWGAADESEHYIDDYFCKLANTYENFEFVPLTGHGIIDSVAARSDDLGACRIYISGPPAMISALIGLLRRKGADPAKIGYDRHPEAASLNIKENGSL